MVDHNPILSTLACGSVYMKIIILGLFHNWSIFSSFHNNIHSLTFSYRRVEQIKKDTILQVNIAFIVDNPCVIAICSSPYN